VPAVTVVAAIGLLKVTFGLIPVSTPVAPAAGDMPVTSGGVASPSPTKVVKTTSTQ
jgi:hypothetical protein